MPSRPEAHAHRPFHPGARDVGFNLNFGLGLRADETPGYEVALWNGILAPARTPPPVIQKLNIEIRKAAQSAEVIRSLGTQATSPTSNTPEEFAAFIKSEQSRFAVIVKESGARAD